MRLISWLRHLWWNLALRRGVEAALDEEVRGYVDLLAADYERSGMSAAAARRAALVDCRGVEQVKESARDAWIGNTMTVAARDLRFVLRSLRRAPVFALTAVATLGIGIVAGIGGSMLFIHLLRSMFAGLDGVDLTACAFAVAILAVVALLASYLPARRAARLDVVAALRSD